MKHFEQRLESLSNAINAADAIIVGAGAGLSAAAGLTYSGERFERNFAEYIAKYNMSDMYSAGFYPFDSQEAKWAYWSRHIDVNRHRPGATRIYRKLKSLVQGKPYFVLTTNVDGQFEKAGFDEKRIFATQGDYGKIQCATPCHDKLYDNQALVSSMLREQKDCMIPSELVPQCPVCGGDMAMHLRADNRFVENADWHNAADAYQHFVGSVLNKRILLLEIGVGYNTPSIIKYPFEQITAQAPDATLVRINRDYPEVSAANKHKTIVFDEEIWDILRQLALSSKA